MCIIGKLFPRVVFAADKRSPFDHGVVVRLPGSGCHTIPCYGNKNNKEDVCELLLRTSLLMHKVR